MRAIINVHCVVAPTAIKQVRVGDGISMPHWVRRPEAGRRAGIVTMAQGEYH